MFRSLDMSYLQVLVPSAVAEDFADLMARKDLMQFTDLNEDFQPFQRAYTSDIIKIQEIERRLRAIEDELQNYGVRYVGEIKPDHVGDSPRPEGASTLVQTTGEEINDAYKNLKEQTTAEKQLKAELDNQQNIKTVLLNIDHFIAHERQARGMLVEAQHRVTERQRAQDEELARTGGAVPLLNAGQVVFRSYADAASPSDVGFKYLAGVVSVAQRVSFERQVFLTSRGNSFVQFDEDSDEERISFVVFYLGEQLQRSLRRLCQFMNIAICYESDSEVDREQLLQDATAKEEDFRRIHHATHNGLKRSMRKVAENIQRWKIILLQEKSIRIALNKFKSQGTMYRAEGWVPTSRRAEIDEILEMVVQHKGVGRAIVSEQQPQGMPPTAYDLNEFTQVFQEIVDTYGCPRYKEFNPAVPTIVTFPFLFGVMYGDMFHGSCIFLFGMFLVLAGGPLKLKDTGLADMYKARYMVAMMGFFAIYCGLIYNDAMSLAFNGFNGSQWSHRYVQDSDGIERVVVIQHNVYTMGVDSAWRGVENQLDMVNSLKMKMAVILGVSQMTFGLFLKMGNHLFEGDNISLFWEFVPQLIFMMSFFGYMLFLIFYKWTINWRTSNLPDIPSLITILIKMVLAPGSVPSEAQIFSSSGTQAAIQAVLLLCMMGSIPVMLFVKPYLLKKRHEESQRSGDFARLHPPHDEHELLGSSEHSEEKHDVEAAAETKVVAAGGGGHGHGEEFVFSEIMIHQLIHTIEYVLGTVSNTASYLRLWALSLAHAELSDVFYEKTIQGTLSGSGPQQVIMNVIGVFLFLMFTFAVLLVMDVLECFLHALRLHWVEFQNKFFYADGVAFKPFSYRLALKAEDE
jgi:V-type H+-transporting ATPase subunit a